MYKFARLSDSSDNSIYFDMPFDEVVNFINLKYHKNQYEIKHIGCKVELNYKGEDLPF